MSGNPTTPDGSRGQHLRAVRDWLARAEAQFAHGKDVMAAATLMLAGAELRLLVEGVASGAAVEERAHRPRVFRLTPATRTLLGAASLAACLVIGFAIGRIGAVTSPAIAPSETPAPVIQIAETSEATVEIIPEIPAATEIEAIPTPDESLLAEESAAMAEAPQPSPQPSRRPRPRVTSAEAPSTADVAQTPEPSTPEPVEAQPAEEPEPVEAAPSSEKISPAEVALRTIRALSERLFNGDEN